jgi:hypothetical protein
MNRTVVSGVAAFALTVGAALAMTETTAEAGHCGGGLFARLHARSCGGGLFSGGGHLFNKGCGGGLLARLRARHAANCCAPEPACCEPAPAPCCEPAPAPCCGAEPAPCDSGCGGSAGCGSGRRGLFGCRLFGGGSVSCGSGCGEPVGCGSGCGGSVVVGCSGAGCGGEVIMMEETIEGELVAPESSSDAATEVAPPAPAPDAQTDA